jgi:hypothetical protein
MLETRPQVADHSAKPGSRLCSCPSDCFPAPSTCSPTSASCIAPRASAPAQRAYRPAILELGPSVTHQGDDPEGDEVGKPGGWVIGSLNPHVRADSSLAGRGHGHGHASTLRKWCGRLGIEHRTARNALNVLVSRCYQSEQRMHISPAAGPGAPGQRRDRLTPLLGSRPSRGIDQPAERSLTL